jgi:hypothetical protein
MVYFLIHQTLQLVIVVQIIKKREDQQRKLVSSETFQIIEESQLQHQHSISYNQMP